MPTLDGLNIFGADVHLKTAFNPRDKQLNAAPGVNGLEHLDGGSRGLVSDCSGVLIGADGPTLGALELQWFEFIDGRTHTLADDLGRVWTNVILESFEPTGDILQDQYARIHRRYRARFLHLF